MPSKLRSTRINIRPGVCVLSVLRHLNYMPWFALAEFVDNAIQSFVDWKDDITKQNGSDATLTVDIEVDSQTPAASRFATMRRASTLRTTLGHFGQPSCPTDRTGLCEFGMGMKSAACWFSPVWSVRTSALGEDTEKTIALTYPRLCATKSRSLRQRYRSAKKGHAFHRDCPD